MPPRVIAFYLPQFHPIPENDRWWGKGFTEWTNVAQARPLFRGHYQPRIPADLGFYDLRLPEVREQQAELAKAAGIEGFCYWHYWFGNGRHLLERPFREVLESGRPDFPFCLAWANHSWTNKTWKNAHGQPAMLMEQRYDGESDHRDHFQAVLPAFNDQRYIRIDGNPLFLVYAPLDIPCVAEFLKLWRSLAAQNGLSGIHFVGYTESSSSWQILPDGNKRRVLPRTDNAADVYTSILDLGFDAVASSGKNRAEMLVGGKYARLFRLFAHRLGWAGHLKTYEYKDIMRNYNVPEDAWESVYPSLLPQWDRSPRTGSTFDVYVNSTPELFRMSVEETLKLIQSKTSARQLLFLRSWNEWAEGNYLEPDIKFGMAYIEALRTALTNY
jgi:hypothetical protein